MDLPLFPLHTVLCPGIALPLHIFEPRYRAMVRRCLEEDSPFGVVWIRDGREVGAGTIAIATVGTFAEIREADRLADGRFDLVAVGTGRFRVEEVFVDREPYLVARVEPVEDRVDDEPRARRLSRLVTRRFVRYVAQVRDTADDEDEDGDEGDRVARAMADSAAGEAAAIEEPSADEAAPSAEEAPGPGSGRIADAGMTLAMPGDPTLLSYLLAGIVELDLPHRQALLEADTTDERLADLADVLGREVAFLEQGLRVYAPDPREAAGRRN
jgi:Lon protease-like protein